MRITLGEYILRMAAGIPIGSNVRVKTLAGGVFVMNLKVGTICFLAK